MHNSKLARLNVFRHFITDLATLSKCTDKHTAAIIVDADYTQVYSIGINGGPKGGADCLCTLGNKYTCAHAEAQALAKCNIDCTGKVMLCTLSPCVTCATMIINSGISTLYYINSYKDPTGLLLLTAANVSVCCLPEYLSDQGYLV